MNNTNQSFYQTLSSLLAITKKSLLGFQKAIMFKSKGDLDFSSSIQNIKQIHQQQSVLLRQMPNIIQKHLEMDMCRFIARILEIYGFFKHKYVEVKGYQSMIPYIRDLQKTINSYSINRHSTQILHKCLNISENHLRKLELSENNDKVTKEEQQVDKKIPQQSIPLKKKISKSQKYLNKLLQNVNKSFLAINLDIDFSHYRSSFLRVRNMQNVQELQKQIAQRNQLITREIKRYSKDFKLYLDKCEIKKTNNRRNRMIEQLRRNDSLSSKGSKQQKQSSRVRSGVNFISRKTSNRIQNPINNQHIQEEDLEQSKYQPIQQKNQPKDIQNEINEPLYNIKYNKSNYQMKNVIIGSKIQFQFNSIKRRPVSQLKKLNSSFKNQIKNIQTFSDFVADKPGTSQQKRKGLINFDKKQQRKTPDLFIEFSSSRTNNLMKLANN